MIVITHPDNREILESINEVNGHSEYGIPPNIAIRIKFDSSIPARDIEYEWSPPESDQFCEYGPEDEVWMRPLKIGVFTPIDKGPLFYMINDMSIRTDFMSKLMNPAGVIANSFC